MSFVAVDPASGVRIAEVPFDSTPSVEQKVASAHAAYRDWRLRPVAERVAPLVEMGRLLRERKEQYGAIMTQEMGKPINQGPGEIDLCQAICHYTADNAPSELADEDRELDGPFENFGEIRKGMEQLRDELE